MILLGIVAVILAFTAFAFLLAGLILFALFKLVRRMFAGSKPPPTRNPPANAAIPQKESTFAAGEVVDVPYTEVARGGGSSTRPQE